MQKVVILFILFLAAFLRLYNLSELMPFIGDQGWFYLSARDMLLTGNIPLVGIASSHPWLHQGAYWTYILGLILGLFNFHPLAPGYFTASLGVVTVYLVYKIGSKMFSARIGYIAALLYATSPLIVIHDRFPYHTSFISLFTLFFVYSVYKWVKGELYNFPLAIFFLAILYNFEIATTPFVGVLLVLLSYGIGKKKEYIKKIVNKKIISISFFAWLLPMVPMLLYDLSHGFPQTVKFVLWIGYRIARLFGFPSIQGETVAGITVPFLPFTITEFQRLIFLPNNLIALGVLMISVGYIVYRLYADLKKKKYNTALIILLLSFIFPFVAYFTIRTPSEAYFPMLFPTTVFLLAITFDVILKQKKAKFLGFILLIVIVVGNSFVLVKNTYLMGKDGYGQTFSVRLNTAKAIINKAKKKEYNIVGKGAGSEFSSFTMNYHYLIWWLGDEPSKTPQKLKFIISE